MQRTSRWVLSHSGVGLRPEHAHVAAGVYFSRNAPCRSQSLDGPVHRKSLRDSTEVQRDLSSEHDDFGLWQVRRRACTRRRSGTQGSNRPSEMSLTSRGEKSTSQVQRCTRIGLFSCAVRSATRSSPEVGCINRCTAAKQSNAAATERSAIPRASATAQTDTKVPSAGRRRRHPALAARHVSHRFEPPVAMPNSL